VRRLRKRPSERTRRLSFSMPRRISFRVSRRRDVRTDPRENSWFAKVQSFELTHGPRAMATRVAAWGCSFAPCVRHMALVLDAFAPKSRKGCWIPAPGCYTVAGDDPAARGRVRFGGGDPQSRACRSLRQGRAGRLLERSLMSAGGGSRSAGSVVVPGRYERGRGFSRRRPSGAISRVQPRGSCIHLRITCAASRQPPRTSCCVRVRARAAALVENRATHILAGPSAGVMWPSQPPACRQPEDWWSGIVLFRLAGRGATLVAASWLACPAPPMRSRCVLDMGSGESIKASGDFSPTRRRPYFNPDTTRFWF